VWYRPYNRLWKKSCIYESEDEEEKGTGKNDPPAAFLLPLEGSNTVKRYLIEL
jgi:hypothetical protein